MNSEETAAAITEIWDWISVIAPSNRVLRRDGVTAYSSGLPDAKMNVVLTERVSPPAETVTALLDELAATGQPYNLALRADAPSYLKELAANRGLTLGSTVPLMVTTEAPAVPPPAGLSIRPLAPGEVPVFLQVVTAAFETDEESYLRAFPRNC